MKAAPMICMRLNVQQEPIFVFGLNDEDLEKLKLGDNFIISSPFSLRLKYSKKSSVEFQDLTVVGDVDDKWIDQLRKFAQPGSPFATFRFFKKGRAVMFAYGKTDEECKRNIQRRFNIEIKFMAEWRPRKVCRLN